MAFTGTGDILGGMIKAAVDAETAAAVAQGRAVDRDAMFNAIGAAISAYLVTNGVGAVIGTSAPGGGPVVSSIT